MKVLALAISFAVGVASASVKRSAASFGPENCVALTRSAAGSCVISTDCEGADLSQTEFAFDCVGKPSDAGIVRHSFGTGGFETTEEFDTEVKCARCESPSAADVVVGTHAKKAAAPKPVPKATAKVVEAPKKVPQAAVVFKAKRRHSAKVASKAKAKAKAQIWPFDGMFKQPKQPETVKYGPNGCVSTWKSAEGHCMMKTSCAKVNISKYEFGLVCVDKVGSPVRHLFGKDSFDNEETFDTLIKCDQCLGLEDIPDEVALNGEVMTMTKDIANLKDVMKNISINVQMLNEEVFKKAPAPAAAGPAPAAAKGLVQHSTERHRTSSNLRHSHKKHHRHQDDDDDEGEDEDEDDDSEDDHSRAATTASDDRVEKSIYRDDDREDDRDDSEDED